MSWSVHDAALKSNSTLETVEIKGRVINVASLFIVQEFREFRFKLYRCTCPIIIYIRIFSIYPQKSNTKLTVKTLTMYGGIVLSCLLVRSLSENKKD